MTAKVWRGAALGSAAAALIIMVLPTWPLTFGLSYGEYQTTYQAWFDPVLPGYASFGPPISLLLTIVGIVLALAALVRPGRQRGPAWLFGLAAAIAVLDRIILTSPPTAWVAVAVAALLLASVSSVLAMRAQRPEPATVSDRRVPAPR